MTVAACFFKRQFPTSEGTGKTGTNVLNANSSVNKSYWGVDLSTLPTEEDLEILNSIETPEGISGVKVGGYAQFFAGASVDIALVMNTDDDWAILYSETGYAGTSIEAKGFIGFFDTYSTTDIERLLGKTVTSSIGGGYILVANYEHGLIADDEGLIHINGSVVGLGKGAGMTGGLSHTEYLIKHIDGETHYNYELIMELILSGYF